MATARWLRRALSTPSRAYIYNGREVVYAGAHFLPHLAVMASRPLGLAPDRGGAALRSLDADQRRACDNAMASKSMFLSGVAGAGKTFVLKIIVDTLRDLLGDDAVAVTGMTGVAGANAGGTTVHAWAGIGLGKGPISALLAAVQRSHTAVMRWISTH